MFRGFEQLWRTVLLALGILLGAINSVQANVAPQPELPCDLLVASQFQEIAMALPEEILAFWAKYVEPGPPHDEVNIAASQFDITAENVYLGAPFIGPYFTHRRAPGQRQYQWDMGLHVAGVLHSAPTLRRFHQIGHTLLKSLYQPNWKQKSDREAVYAETSNVAIREILVSQIRDARALEPIVLPTSADGVAMAAKEAMRADWEFQFQTRIAGIRRGGGPAVDQIPALEQGHQGRMAKLDDVFRQQLPTPAAQRTYLLKQRQLQRQREPLEVPDDSAKLFTAALDARIYSIRVNFEKRIRAEVGRERADESEIRTRLAPVLATQIAEAEATLRQIMFLKDRAIRSQVYEQFSHQFRAQAERYQIRFDHNPLGLIEMIATQPHAVAEFRDNQFVFPEVTIDGVRRRPTDRSTWMVGKIKAAYEDNARKGHVHSVEVYNSLGLLVGGLIYIVGELVPTPAGLAMFHDASYQDIGKLALLAVTLQGYLQGFELTKCENYVIPNMLPAQLGAVNIPRADFNRVVFRDRDLGLRMCSPIGDFAPVIEQFLKLSPEQMESFLLLPRESRQPFLTGR